MFSGAGDNADFGSAGSLEGGFEVGIGDSTSATILYAEVHLVSSNLLWEKLERNSFNSREASRLVYGQQGGELIDLLIQGNYTWPDTTYRVDLISVLGQTFPDDRPGCFGAMEGYGSTIYPMYGYKVLRFALPRAPLGAYDILITSANGSINARLNRAIRLAPSQTSIEVNRYRTFFNPEVYSKRGHLT